MKFLNKILAKVLKLLISIKEIFTKETLNKFLSLSSNILSVGNSNNVMQMAASLTYYTLITIIPMFSLIVPIMNSIGISDYFFMEIHFILTGIIGNSHASQFIEVLRTFTTNSASLGILSALIFLFSSTRLINRVFTSTNNIYKAPNKPTTSNTITHILFNLVFFIVVIMFVAFFVFTKARILEDLSKTPEGFNSFAFKLLHSKFLSFIILNLVLFSLIVFVPNIYVKLRNALYGTLFSSISIMIITTLSSKFVYFLYRNSTIIYGSSVSILVLLFCAYWIWVIVFFGVTISYVTQYNPDIENKSVRSIAEHIINETEMLCIIARSFENSNGGVFLYELCEKLHLSSYEIIAMADKFIEAKIIYPIGKLKTRRYCIAIPPQKITVYFVLNVIFGTYKKTEKNDAIYSLIQNKLTEVFSTKTLTEYM